MTRPAARIGDPHQCPKAMHIGGALTAPGEPTVLVGGDKAARFTDMAACSGAVDAVSMGAPTVLMGKLLAARLADPTEHGGVILAGCPRVLVGEPPPWVSVVRRGNVLIITDHKARTIRMVGVQEFAGSGASDDYVKRATENINKTWSGSTTLDGVPYKVDCMITGRKTGMPANPLANQIDVKKTNDPPSVTTNKDPSWQSLGGAGDGGYQHSTDADGGVLIPAHEFGHAMGLEDEYKEGPLKPDGNRSLTRTGPKGGLMGYIDPGSKPTPDNFNELVKGKKK